MSRDTLHHISLSYIKNNNNNDFHTKTLWLSGCAKFGIKRVRLMVALPTYLKAFVAQEGSLAFSTERLLSEGPYAAACYTTGIFFGSSEGKVRFVPNTSSNSRLFPQDNRYFIHTEMATKKLRQRSTFPQHTPMRWHIHTWLVLMCRKEVQCEVFFQGKNFQNNFTIQNKNRTRFSLRRLQRNPEVTTATINILQDFTVKKSICLLLRHCGSAAEWSFAGPFCPSHRNVFYHFPHHSSTAPVPSEGRVCFKEAVQIKTWWMTWSLKEITTGTHQSIWHMSKTKGASHRLTLQYQKTDSVLATNPRLMCRSKVL